MTPTAEVTSLRPGGIEELAGLLHQATMDESVVQVVGGGTRQGYGSPVVPDLRLDMGAFSGIQEWDPDDLTVTVGAGTRVADLESTLSTRSQSAVLPEVAGESTVGGVISAGVSALRRGRLYGLRERVLEVTLVTGDGRIVRGGGRVVKNVTGYDLPRLVVGAFGSLGVVVSICFKLWPVPPAAATVTVDDLAVAARVTRPLAVLEVDGRIMVFLVGTAEDVDSVSRRLGGHVEPGHRWPVDPTGDFRWSLSVPPALTGEAVSRLPDGWRYLAIRGVGEIRAASTGTDGAEQLRRWAEEHDGRLVVVDRPAGVAGDLDPWGRPPPGLDLQRRLIAQFDPARVINRGRLPAGL